jgi:hypothetical protein
MNAGELYKSKMPYVLCPKCRNEAIGGSGFWGASKPYCSYCGWNLERAKETERKALKQAPWTLLLFIAFFVALGYVSKSGFSLFPFLFLSLFIAGYVIVWRKLRLLESSHPAGAYTSAATGILADRQDLQNITGSFQYLQNLNRPRPVRLKPVPRIISIAFPLSIVLIAILGYQMVRLSPLKDLIPILFVSLIWSTIGIMTIRTARRDRRLLSDGEFAVGIITSQELSGGKHRRSTIRYQFKNAAGLLVEGEGTDDSRHLYEDMQIAVFYDPAHASENVALACASCEFEKT